MSKLYQDAILDAKALRASAMANAKAALEEAFEPKIQEMLRLKLSEELEEIADEAEVEQDMANMEETYSENEMEETADINEAELEEILNQLEELSNVDEVDHDKMEEESLNEAEEEEEEESEEEEVEDEEGEVEGEEEFGDNTKIIDITLGDLKQVLQSVMAGSQDMGMDIPSDEADADSEAEAEISLDEILAELEAEGMEDADHRDPGYGVAKQKPVYPELEEKKKDDKEKDKVEEELEEANSTIEELRHSLQEVNLLNAKYLYMNKLFKAKTLTESQKVKVINALDRASSVTEVKNTYETLKESFESKKQLKESIGFASQAAGIAPKQPIIEQNNMMSRWQKLAGIK
jgi:nucleoside 2-deoxyribosyltransferase